MSPGIFRDGNCWITTSSTRYALRARKSLQAKSPPSICPNRSFLLQLSSSGLGLNRGARYTISRIMIVSALVASLCACSPVKSARTLDETQALSPRVIRVGDPVPKGGGVYKLGDPYLAGGKWYVPVNDTSYDRTGFASWYGDFFHGRRTANGEVYDMNALTAAHPTLPLPTYAKVTNLVNHRSVVVRINDRGPYKEDRLIDLSRRAAELLGFYGHGTAPVRVQYYGPAPLDGDDKLETQVLAQQPWAAKAVRSQAAPLAPSSHLFSTAVTTAMRSGSAQKVSYQKAAIPPESSGWQASTLGVSRPPLRDK